MKRLLISIGMLFGLAILLWFGSRVRAQDGLVEAARNKAVVEAQLAQVRLAAPDEAAAGDAPAEDENVDEAKPDEPPAAAEEGGDEPTEEMPDEAITSEQDAEMGRLNEADDDLQQRTDTVVDRYKSAETSAERAKLRQSLAGLVNEHFDVRQKRRELEIQRLDEEVKRLRKSIERRSAARDKIVERRMDELIGEDGDDLSF